LQFQLTAGDLSLLQLARAALIMDRADLSHGATSNRHAYPGLPCTSLSMCLQT